jgi:hypothetical protein
MGNPQALIHRIKRVPLREVFARDEHDFTTWLEDNIDALADELGLKLAVLHKEYQVGPYHADLLCQDGDGGRVIIEDQLEPIDLGHLGRVLMYMVNMDAKTAIWVAADAAHEYNKVVTWLNESTPADVAFYLVKAEAVRIGDSAYAPLFTVLVRPDQVSKHIGQAHKDLANDSLARKDFWGGLLEKSRMKTNIFSGLSPQPTQWFGGAVVGKPGVSVWCGFFSRYGEVQLNINYDQHTGIKNKVIFDALYAQKDSIEREFGEQLLWERTDNQRVSRIRKRFRNAGQFGSDTWPILQDKMIDALIQFDRVFRPRIERIQV